MEKESSHCALALKAEKWMYFISAFEFLPFFSFSFFCFEEAWNSKKLVAALQLHRLTVSGQAPQCLRAYPEMGTAE